MAATSSHTNLRRSAPLLICLPSLLALRLDPRHVIGQIEACARVVGQLGLLESVSHESQVLSELQQLLLSQQRVLGRFWVVTVRWGQRFGGDVVVKVPCVGSIDELWNEWWDLEVDGVEIEATEPSVRLGNCERISYEVNQRARW